MGDAGFFSGQVPRLGRLGRSRALAAAAWQKWEEQTEGPAHRRKCSAGPDRHVGQQEMRLPQTRWQGPANDAPGGHDKVLPCACGDGGRNRVACRSKGDRPVAHNTGRPRQPNWWREECEGLGARQMNRRESWALSGDCSESGGISKEATQQEQTAQRKLSSGP